MQVSEEPGVAYPVQQANDSFAGMPIKKRPVVRASSPPSRMASLLTSEADTLQGKQSMISELGSPLLPVSGVPVAAKGYLEDGGGCLMDRNVNFLPSNGSSTGFSHQHLDATITIGGEEISSKCKLTTDEKATFQRSVGDTELSLAPEKHLGGKLMSSDQSALHGVSGNTKSLLVPEKLGESSKLPIEGQNSGGSCLGEDKLHHYLGLVGESCFGANCGKLKIPTLIEEEYIQSTCNFSESKSYCTNMCANRSNWDLNTLMDSWDGPSSSFSVSCMMNEDGGLHFGGICDKKSAICLAEMNLRELKERCRISGKYAPLGSENSIKSTFSSTPPEEEGHDFKASLHMELNQSLGLQSCCNQPAATSSIVVNSAREASNLNLPLNVKPPADNMKLVDRKQVKSEPFEGGNQIDFKIVEGCYKKLLNCVAPKLEPQIAPKPEPFDEGGLGLLAAHASNLKLVIPGVVKSEPLEKSRQERQHSAVVDGIQCQVGSCTLGLPLNGEVADEGFENVVMDSNLISDFGGPSHKDLAVTGQVGCISQTVDIKSSVKNGAADENINKFADIKDAPSSSDSELVVPNDEVGPFSLLAKQWKDDNDYEDGEVQDLSVDNVVEGACDVGEAKQSNPMHLENGKVGDSCCISADRAIVSSDVKGNNDKTGRSDKQSNAHCIGEDSDTVVHKKMDLDTCTAPCLDESSATEVPTTASIKKREIKATTQKVPRDCSERKDALKGIEITSDQAVSTSQETITDDGQGDTVSRREKVKASNPAEASKANLSRKLRLAASAGASKDVHGRSNKSCIINFCRSHGGSSSAKSKYIPGRLSLSRAGRERFVDKRNKLHWRNRDESCMDGYRRFDRERNVDQPVGKSGVDYMHVRKRINCSLDDLGGGWESDWDYAPEGGTTDFRLMRTNKATAFTAGMLEHGEIVVAPDGAAERTGRARRNTVGDDVQALHHLPPRMQSLGVREGPIPLGVPMDHRLLRDISPGRCIDGGTDMVLLRQSRGREGLMPVNLPVARGSLRDISPDRCIRRGGPDVVVRGSLRDISPERCISRGGPVLRQSGRREGLVPAGMQVPRAATRDISPDRFIGRSGPDVVLLKRKEKFIRGSPEMLDSFFSRPQPHYQQVQGPFMRRERSLSPIQRVSAHVPCIVSNSPPGRRTCSPCPWSPPRRQSLDRLDGHSELMHGRSPPILRVERVRGPYKHDPHEHPSAAEDMIGRRHGSPSYSHHLSNNVMRDVVPSVENDPPRILIRRSPSGRVSHRIARRIDMINYLKRAEGNEHFGQLHSKRVRGFVGDESLDERWECNERHTLFRPLRPQDVSAAADGFSYHAGDDPRPHRVCPVDATQMNEGDGLRNFDGRTKYRLDNSRIPQSMEEQEENYRHSRAALHEPNYEITRLKKRKL